MIIQIDPHTLERAEERGTSEREIREVVQAGSDIPAKRGRRARAKVYEFNNNWAGRYYEQRRVEVIYVEEGSRITTVTVYVFYGKWE
ncbi:MAG: DUF4258 domain-containing protein [Armatimonadetes bacterium]|nr:DUF4258 domain-containing protein [Armatimonadota bacterium]